MPLGLKHWRERLDARFEIIHDIREEEEGEMAFDPQDPLYREFVMRASRMEHPVSPDYVPSKEYLELLSCDDIDGEFDECF
jgi:hypothetical protein